MKKVIINNMPAYAKSEKYIVATRDEEGDLWFWGAYSNLNTAGRAIDCNPNRELFESREVT